MKRIEKSYSILLALSFAAAGVMMPQHLQAQTSTYLPQIADGGNWYTAIELNNTGTTAALVQLTFFQDTTNGTTIPWNPPFVEVSSTTSVSVPAGGITYIHTAGTAPVLTQGWAQVTKPATAQVEVTAIYTYETFAGRPNQDGTSPATAGGSRILLPFDATSGYSTGVAIVNPTSTSESVGVNIELDSGAILSGTTLALPTNGQLAFNMASQFPVTIGHRGQAEFFVTGGTISIAAFRINPTLALTSIPVTETSGSPIIGATAITALPQFKEITVNLGNPGDCPPSLGCFGRLLIVKSKVTPGYGLALLNLTANFGGVPDNVLAGFTSITQNGLNFTFTNVPLDNFSFITQSSLGNVVNVNIAPASTLTLTFAPFPDNPAAGSVTGVVNIPGWIGTTSPITITGAFSAQ